MERLQKIISRAGMASRRDAEKYITEGRVTVNGAAVTELGTKVDPSKDTIRVDGKVIRSEKYVYLMLNKPKGIITTLSDPRGRQTVADLVSDVPERVYPVGRLDYGTEGLLLMTNDGELTHALIHPSSMIDKKYVAKVAGIPPEDKLDKLRAGIKLADGITAPARVYLLDADPNKNTAQIEVTIHEGKNRQVRRMFEAIGYPVERLKRIQYAFLTLDGLPRGQYRHLTANEVQQLKKMALKK